LNIPEDLERLPPASTSAAHVPSLLTSETPSITSVERDVQTVTQTDVYKVARVPVTPVARFAHALAPGTLQGLQEGSKMQEPVPVERVAGPATTETTVADAGTGAAAPTATSVRMTQDASASQRTVFRDPLSHYLATSYDADLVRVDARARSASSSCNDVDSMGVDAAPGGDVPVPAASLEVGVVYIYDYVEVGILYVYFLKHKCFHNCLGIQIDGSL